MARSIYTKLKSFDQLAKALPAGKKNDSKTLESFFIKSVNPEADVDKLLSHAEKIIGVLTGEHPQEKLQETLDSLASKDEK